MPVTEKAKKKPEPRKRKAVAVGVPKKYCIGCGTQAVNKAFIHEGPAGGKTIRYAWRCSKCGWLGVDEVEQR